MMSKQSKGDETLSAIVNAVDAEVKRHKAFIDEERSVFHRMSGARHVLISLYKVGAIHPDFTSLIGAWVKEGGVNRLTIDGVDITAGR